MGCNVLGGQTVLLEQIGGRAALTKTIHNAHAVKLAAALTGNGLCGHTAQTADDAVLLGSNNSLGS